MYNELDRIIHQPIRTKIMAYLIAQGTADYTTIKNMFHLSDGHMTTHMRELLEHNYVYTEKEFINNKPRTTYFVTDIGKKAFSAYIATLKKIIHLEE